MIRVHFGSIFVYVIRFLREVLTGSEADFFALRNHRLRFVVSFCTAFRAFIRSNRDCSLQLGAVIKNLSNHFCPGSLLANYHGYKEVRFTTQIPGNGIFLVLGVALATANTISIITSWWRTFAMLQSRHSGRRRRGIVHRSRTPSIN